MASSNKKATDGARPPVAGYLRSRTYTNHHQAQFFLMADFIILFLF